MKACFIFLSLILLILYQTPSLAQDIRSKTDNTVIGPGDTVLVTFTIDGLIEDYKNFVVPIFDGLQAAGGPYLSQISNTQSLNGVTTSSKSIGISCQILALREGTFTIGPAHIENAEGKTLYSDSITITAISGFKKPSRKKLHR